MSTVRCAKCKCERAIAEFDINRNGAPFRTCRSCLTRVAEMRRQRAALRAQQNAQDLQLSPPRVARRVRQSEFPTAFLSSRLHWKQLELGAMNVVCESCAALHWIDERVAASSKARPRFESCCKKGDVQLPSLQAPPDYLQFLLQSTEPVARMFRANIREYNSALTFTSVKYTADQRPAMQRGGVHCFQIHGELYHMQGPLQPGENASPSFAQLYFYDPNYAAGVRHEAHPNLNLEVLQRLTTELHTVNPFIGIYKTARERLMESEPLQGPARVLLSPQLRLIMESGADKRRENLPTSNEVAVIIPDEYGQPGFRDIVLANRDIDGNEAFNIIDPNNAAYMPLHYVLLFPKGDVGWHWGLTLRNDLQVRKNLRLSQRVFYRYRLHTRNAEFPNLFHSQRLFQQYLVDAWAVCDQNKLNWIRLNQSQLRADLYNGLADAMLQQDFNAEETGRRVILPSSYTGGDRYMQQLYQDSMAIVRHFGRPTLFITFTANPKWQEIVVELLPGQTAVDRPDLTARIFHMKQQQLLAEIKHKNIFGRYLGCVWTIEYQKRGLPHMHLLLFLHPDDRFLTAERIDEIVCAELPDPIADPNGELRAIITTCMVHGPCGERMPNAPCMTISDAGFKKCAKRFPKAFQDETLVQEDGYPLYRRRNNGQTHTIPLRGSGGTENFAFDNRWVVPYNPYLSWRYKAHINVEVCASIHAIKYIHKYIYKGADRTTLQVGNEDDEVKRYLQGRYIGPTEAVWRIFEFGMHEEAPAVMHLAVHLPGEQAVYYDMDANRDEILQQMESAKSTLMAFFQYNADNIDGRTYLYQEFPAHFTYNKPNRKWSRRKGGISIGRMYYCNPMMGEKYYLRLLLTVVRGATSFEHLRTVSGEIQPSFKAACVVLGLLEDDREWMQCFTEAVLFASGAALRTLFATALLFGDLTDAKALWATFGNNICDDIPRILERNEAFAVPIELQDPHLDYGLYLISRILADSGKTLSDFDLPAYIHSWNRTAGNQLIALELAYDQDAEKALCDERVAKLNDDQLRCYNTIVASVNNPATAQFFLQGPAGTGKTFLYNAICNHFRSQGKIVICVASSSIAAQLLPGGRTSHSRFKIPIVVNESSICSFTRNTLLAGLLQRADLIIWDEVPMQHKYCFEAVNRSLNDICGVADDALFGNIPMVLGGDFAQILPIVRRGNRGATVAACLQRSFLWPRFQQLSLKKNMRVLEGSANQQFASWLLQLSYDAQWNGRISLPGFISVCTTVPDICEHVFPTTVVASAHTNHTAFKGRAILAMRNDTVAEFNNTVLESLQGDVRTYYSSDSAEFSNSEEASNELPAEYLQSLNLAALPPSHLRLKIGAPVILLRNLYPKQGLCNGTRMTVIRMERRCIEVRLLGGDNDGQVKVIPRIKLSTTEGELPFILTRKQFPVRLCFAMTVNKAQGQSLDIVGIDLRTPPFAHGQLYVALSRATDVNKLRILQAEERGRDTENIVYPEVLLRA